MKISKELYEQPYWKKMQEALFETFDIHCFDGAVLDVICSGPYVPKGIFTVVATDLAKVDGKTDLAVVFYDSAGNEFKTVIIQI